MSRSMILLPVAFLSIMNTLPKRQKLKRLSSPLLIGDEIACLADLAKPCPNENGRILGTRHRISRSDRMSDCLFCSIVEGKIEGEIVHRDELVTAFRDINPVAPVHLLIVPNHHVASVSDLGPEDEATAGRMLSVARKLAEQEGVIEDGYRLIINTGPHAGQEVHHLHMHLIGGQRMRYPMG
jgi:histidine triad (HIT) family protein